MVNRGFFLINGIGVNRDVEKGIACYKTALEFGDKNAESCLSVAIMKYYSDSRKIEFARQAYLHGNKMMVKYIDNLVTQINIEQKKYNSGYQSATIWDLPETELLEILNYNMEQWVGSNRTYATTMSTSSTPTFTRRFLYTIGNSYVYEEMNVIKFETFPSWFSEEEIIWELSETEE